MSARAAKGSAAASGQARWFDRTLLRETDAAHARARLLLASAPSDRHISVPMAGSPLKRARKQGVRLADGSIVAFPYMPRVADLPPGWRHFCTTTGCLNWVEPAVPGPVHRRSDRSGQVSRSCSAAFPAPSASPAWPLAFSPASNIGQDLFAVAVRSGLRRSAPMSAVPLQQQKLPASA
jgi:hypothetical protein